jgi:adenylate kinase
VKERLGRPDTAHGFVLDGFPRTVGQAEALDGLVASRDNGPLVIVDVRVPEDELVRRLGTRRICESCGTTAEPAAPGHSTCPVCRGTLVQRIDDEARVVLERLRVYEDSTQPVLEYYRRRPTFRVVNGAQSPERVAQDLESAVNQAAAGVVVAAPVPSIRPVAG